jgi:hypothetical protein
MAGCASHHCVDITSHSSLPAFLHSCAVSRLSFDNNASFQDCPHCLLAPQLGAPQITAHLFTPHTHRVQTLAAPIVLRSSQIVNIKSPEPFFENIADDAATAITQAVSLPALGKVISGAESKILHNIIDDPKVVNIKD